MALRVSGKNVDIGDALRTHIVGRVDEVLSKYFNGASNGHVTVEKEGNGFRTECALHLATGITVQSASSAQDPYKSVDAGIDRIEKQMRRYKRKIRDYHAGTKQVEVTEGGSYRVLEAPDEEEEVPTDFAPVVVAEQTQSVKTLSVGGAVMELDLTQADVVVFRNAKSGGINVVFRRKDGNIGWIDPALDGKSA